MTWQPVVPLVDDEPAASVGVYEQTFHIGQRVRVRLSGECQQRFGNALDSVDGPLLRTEVHVGHRDSHNGRLGTVDLDLRSRWPEQVREYANRHFIVVRFDEWDEFDQSGSTFAPCELEPL